MRLCSACLLGIQCGFNGHSKENEKVMELAEGEGLVPVCPEQLGGLPTPRPQTEIRNGKIVTVNGVDQTEFYEKGAQEVLKLCQRLGIKEVIFQQRSPSCGCGLVYDGSFTGKLINGDGITTKLLKVHGIRVKSMDSV